MDISNSQAKSFVRAQLGSCHELLLTVLRRIISGDIRAAPAPDAAARSPDHDKLDEITKYSENFLMQFMNCRK